MKIGIIGMRGSMALLSCYLPKQTKAIVSGRARGIETYARIYAFQRGYDFIECNIPSENMTVSQHTQIRDRWIVEMADCILFFGRNSSRRMRTVQRYCQELERPIILIVTEKKR